MRAICCLLGLFLLASPADAASRFWVGGTGTWDSSTTTNWAASTGGAGGQSVPGSGDTVTFDANSGGGTVTVNTTVNVTSITMGAFTGTLDFSVNNNNVTVSTFNGSGTGTRTLKLGNGTWTVSSAGAAWTMTTTTGLTFNANSSNITLSRSVSSTTTFAGGGLTYSTLTVNSNTSGGETSITGANTFATLTIQSGNFILLPSSTTTTITNAFTWTGTANNPIMVQAGTSGTAGTISVASGSPTVAWGVLKDITCSGGASFSATNSLSLGNNTGISISTPSGGTSQPNVIGG